MITPRFACSQNEASLVVVLHVPAIRARDVEIIAQDTTLVVHVNPYFLRLVFEGTGGVVDDDESNARYDPSSGDLTITVSKQVKGESFPDLDLLPKLLAPEGSRDREQQPLIEVLDEEDAILQAAENDWQLPQQVAPVEELLTGQKQSYGFLNLHSGFFTHVAHAENDVNVLGLDIETLPASERSGKLHESEEKKWDEEYYMMDYIQDEEIRGIIEWEYPFRDDEFDEAEVLAQLRLPRREYLIDAGQARQLHVTLVSVLFSYFYDARATGRDPTSESAWTISALTPCFVALSTHATVRETLVASYRRALCYPLYRSFALCERVRADVGKVLGLGVKAVLRVLLEANAILAGHDVYYVYSKVWVEDYCVWIARHATAESLSALGREVGETEVGKGAVGWPLEELELAAKMAEADIDSDDE
ncbi:SHQ1-domain-containing protein [Exidia glandulosa HHB12029]|uniref:SHQ1-domain-containing protein n=1 Tax=Exidia glandulosa HHB12029 TaxID=1314781 RepID=A0A165DFJ2_EXIGL|nr:SHQ1-domain-containing protein [Exidia glandulosa HHB12029]